MTPRGVSDPSSFCVHEMSLWLGGNFAHKDSLVGMNKGGTVEAAGLKVSMVRAEHSSGDIYAGAESLYMASRLASSSNSRMATGSTSRATPTCSATCASSPSAAAAHAVELLGVDAVAPIHYGTFPALAGTPEQLRSELGKRGLGHISVHETPRGGNLG